MEKKMIIALMVITAMLVSCGGSGSMNLGDNEFAVEEITPQSAELSTLYPATIKGIQDVQILPKVSGFLTEVRVHEGETVSRGQVLFVIDNVTYEATVREAQAAVNTAEAQLGTSKLTYENNRQLYEKNIIGQYELSTAENSYTTAQANLAQAQAALASAKEMLSFCYVTSPASGVVGDLPYKVGALVSSASGQPLTTVSDISTMEVYFSMTEKDVLEMSKNSGNTKNVIEAYGDVKLKLADGTIYSQMGKIVKMSGVIDASTGSVSIIAQFPNPDKLLKSGGAAQIVLPKQDEVALIIPQTATSQVQDKVFVYLLDEKDNTVHYTEVKVNPQNDGNNYIVTSGLKAGDKIVVKGIIKLTDGMEIVPISTQRYEEKLQEAVELGKHQDRASDFIDAMSGKKS